MDLKGKVAVVTGASRGIGRAIAVELGRQGMKVVVNYNHSGEAAERAVQDIRDVGADAVACGADVSTPKGARTLVETAVAQYGAVHALINNAAVNSVYSVDALSLEEWERVLRINLTGPFLCSQAVLPYFREAGSGKIVMISSIAGLRGSASAHYVSSKSGMLGLTMALGRELASENILVNAVAPGLIHTDMLAESDPGLVENPGSGVPIGRLGHPEEVAGAVVFALQNDYLTGEVINLSAGRHIGL